MALNKAHEDLDDIQKAYDSWEIKRAEFEAELNQERQEHRICQEALGFEQQCRENIEKHLNSVWNAHTRLAEILANVRCYDGISEHFALLNVSDLVLECEVKTSKINELESEMKTARQEMESTTFQAEEQRRKHAEDLISKSRCIDELDH